MKHEREREYTHICVLMCVMCVYFSVRCILWTVETVELETSCRSGYKRFTAMVD